jgi:DNA-binding NarL/FixJ family response regulator
MSAVATTPSTETNERKIGGPEYRFGPVTHSTTHWTATVHIALVDDEDSMHQLLKRTLTKFAQTWILDSHRDGRQALAEIPKSPPDAVLMDIRMPGITGIECVSRLKNRLPTVPIIMLSGHVDAEILLDSMMAGASGCLCKPAAPHEIVLALKKTLTGMMTFCPRAEKTLLDCFHLLGKDCNGWELTTREHDIIIGLCQQKSDKQISAELGIGTGTVHGHISSILKKLGVHTRAEAIRKILSVNREKA